MKLKTISKILLAILVLTISLGVISAADNNATVLEAPTNNIDKNVLADHDWDDDWDDDDDDDDDWDDDDRYEWDRDHGYHKSMPSKVSKGKIKTKVDADPITVKYKKNSYFKIKVEDRYDDDNPIGKVKLKVKIGKGSKAKTYNVKTNSYGVAKINTKGLKTGTHNVVITSANKKYDISKKSKIIVAKQYSATIKGTSKKVLKNNDIVKVKVRNDDDEKEYKIVLKKKSKSTKITKAVFYFKNKYTGKVIMKTDHAEFDDGRWDLPEEDCSYRYELMKVKVYYMSN